MDVTVAADPDGAADEAVELIMAALDAARAVRGHAHMSLAGGSTPGRAYRLLADRLTTWEGVELWFGDERAVAPEHPDSTFALVRESLVEPAGLDLGQVHRLRGEDDPDEAARAYAELMRERVPADALGVPALDVALLGLGEDGHVASLFPGHPALAVRGSVCVVVRDAPKPPPVRLSLTLDVLRAARVIVVLATGAGKADAVRRAQEGPSEDVPASLLAGAPVHLVVDRAAAGR